MSRANNEPPETIRIGLIAEGVEAERYAAALRGCPAFDWCAQAGLRQSDALDGAAWYDDTRVFFEQSGVEAVVLALSTRAGVELAADAARGGLHVWRPPPLGRDFAEAVQVADFAREGAVCYRVGSWWSHVADSIRAALPDGAAAAPYLSELAVSTGGPTRASWRGDRAQAGGGVLATDGYAMLEALVAMRGLPESVIASVTQGRRRSAEPPRDTEDIAAAILRYEAGGLATVRACWDLPPYEQATRHHHDETTVELTRGSIRVWAADGAPRNERSLPEVSLAVELARFADTIRAPAEAESMARDFGRHVAVAALLEAIYLSARTGQPEVPRKFYQLHGRPEPTR